MPKKKSVPPTLSRPKPRPSRREKLSITIDSELLPELDARGEERSGVIRTDLGRYYRLLADARTRLRDLLTSAELSAVIDVQNGHWYADILYADEIWANVEDGCRLEGLAEKWQIDGPALVEKLKRLPLLEVHALADATVRFWHRVGQGESSLDPARALE